MESHSPIGRITSLWRFPLKSMQGEALDALDVTPSGVLGDRAFALHDLATGKLVSAKQVNAYPNLLSFRAHFPRAPRIGDPLPPIRVTFPDGSACDSDATDIDGKLGAWFGRDVRLVSIDGNAAAHTRMPTTIQARVGPELATALRLPGEVPISPFVDLFPCSLVTHATLARLSTLSPASAFDERRFRMNFGVEVGGDGFVENDWVGRTLAVGETVRLYVAMADPRCALTTLAQPGLPHDAEVLRVMNAHNRLPTVIGEQPCAGVYASVVVPGHVRVGDSVRLLD